MSTEGPEGPYTSPWTESPHFLVPDWRHGQRVWVVVPNGVQRSEGIPFLLLREAHQWLKDNGFELKRKPL